MGFYALTMGNFDGVHRGHRKLLEKTLDVAKKIQGQALVYTFHPHPLLVLNAARAPARLFDLRDQQEQFAKLGLTEVRVIEFNQELALTSAESFFREFILDVRKINAVCVGHDFHFGAGRKGDDALLGNLCLKNSIAFDTLEPFQVDGEIVSSTRVREALSRADIDLAHKLLGRPYYIRGKVVHGAHRGSSIGFPTANLKLAAEMRDQLPLRQGVYAVQVQCQNKLLKGVMNVGVNPTIGNDLKLKIETHLFEWSQNIYDQELVITPLHFLREEKKFADINELKLQIARDALHAKEILR